MQDWVAGTMLVLGTLLVLTGATITVIKTLTPDPGAEPASATVAGPAAVDTPVTSGGRLALWIRRVNSADRLIVWGVVILVLGAVAAGAVSFTLGASAGTR